VTLAASLAGLAGAFAVAAAWEALAALERHRAAATAAGVLAPLRRARREGRAPSTSERRRLALVAAATLLGAGWLLSGLLAGLALAAAGPWVTAAVVRARRRRYRSEVASGAAATARALADALGAGHSVRSALGAAAGGVPGAAGTELRAAAGALDLGEPTEEVLERLRARAQARSFDTITAAILLQRDAGGDLAAVLREVAGALDDAQRLEHDARAATAQARFTGLLVAGLPLGAAGLAELADPGRMAGLLGNPLSAWLLMGAVGLQAGSILAIRRLARART
jgi:tight adherence protein B